MSGKIVVQQQTALQAGNSSFTLNTSSLAAGTYLLVVNGGQRNVKKFIKE
jgi:hypothetical protein